MSQNHIVDANKMAAPIGYSPVYPLAQPPEQSPVQPAQRFPWGVVVAALLGGAIAWAGASGWYGAADVRAMRQELSQAQAALSAQQQTIKAVEGVVCQ